MNGPLTLRNLKYKTRMCENRYHCRYGKKCQFAHSEEEKRKPLNNALLFQLDIILEANEMLIHTGKLPKDVFTNVESIDAYIRSLSAKKRVCNNCTNLL